MTEKNIYSISNMFGNNPERSEKYFNNINERSKLYKKANSDLISGIDEHGEKFDVKYKSVAIMDPKYYNWLIKSDTNKLQKLNDNGTIIYVTSKNFEHDKLCQEIVHKHHKQLDQEGINLEMIHSYAQNLLENGHFSAAHDIYRLISTTFIGEDDSISIGQDAHVEADLPDSEIFNIVDKNAINSLTVAHIFHEDACAVIPIKKDKSRTYKDFSDTYEQEMRRLQRLNMNDFSLDSVQMGANHNTSPVQITKLKRLNNYIKTLHNTNVHTNAQTFNNTTKEFEPQVSLYRAIFDKQCTSIEYNTGPIAPHNKDEELPVQEIMRYLRFTEESSIYGKERLQKDSRYAFSKFSFTKDKTNAASLVVAPLYFMDKKLPTKFLPANLLGVKSWSGARSWAGDSGLSCPITPKEIPSDRQTAIAMQHYYEDLIDQSKRGTHTTDTVSSFNSNKPAIARRPRH